MSKTLVSWFSMKFLSYGKPTANLRQTYGKPTAIRLFDIFCWLRFSFLPGVVTFVYLQPPSTPLENASKDSRVFSVIGPSEKFEVEKSQKRVRANGSTCPIRQTYSMPTAHLRQDMASSSGSWCVARERNSVAPHCSKWKLSIGIPFRTVAPSDDFRTSTHFLCQTYGKPTALRLFD